MGSIVTQAGLRDIATASFTQEKCNWSQIAVGDGDGSDYVPTETQTELRGQKWKGEINNYTATGNSQGIFQAYIPANVGGFTIREIGILNESDELVVIGTVEATPKVALSEDSDHYNDMLINLHIAVDRADVIQVQVDPNITVATQQYVENRLQTIDIDQIRINKENIEKIQKLLDGLEETLEALI